MISKQDVSVRRVSPLGLSALSNAVIAGPNPDIPVIVTDVTVDPEWRVRGEPCVVFADRGCDYRRPYTPDEIRAKLASTHFSGTHEGYGMEHRCYVHDYRCDGTVPADIAEALHRNYPLQRQAAE